MATYIDGDDVGHGRKSRQPSANLSEKGCAFKSFGLFLQLAPDARSSGLSPFC